MKMALKEKSMEEQAEAVVNKYLELEMVPNEALEPVTTYLENDESMEALKYVLDARRQSDKHP